MSTVRARQSAAATSETLPARPSASPAAIWTALVIVYIVWGSTYLAIRVAVEDMPPLSAMASRFVVASALMAAYVAIRHGVSALHVPIRQVGGAALVGLLLLLGGNGLVAVGERSVASGLAALLVAAVPLWIVVLRRSTGDRPRALTWIGVLVGFAGLIVLIGPGAGGSITSMLTIVAATISWSIGSFASPRLPMPANPAVATTYEMLAGGIFMLAVGALVGEHLDFSFGYKTSSLLAIGYLIIFGSIVAFSAYVWLLSAAPISLVATYAYVNPVVAVVLGALLLSEPITAAIVIGGAIVVVGVALVVSAERPRPIPAPDDPPCT